MGNITIVVLRIIHIAAGAFWLGGSVTTAFFLLPTVKATGPIGGQFAGALMQRTRLPEWLTVAGAVAVVTGLLLYWNFYAGLAWTGFEPQVVIGIGGLVAILSLAIGFLFSRPTAGRMSILGKTIQSQGTPPTPVQLAESQELLARLTRLAAVNAILVVITAICMAIGRYAG